MRLLKSLMAFAALCLGSVTTQAQILPQAIGEWEATAAFRALDRPSVQSGNTVVFSNTATGATLLDSDTLTDVNIGLGPDIAFSTRREDGLDYELRFFFSSFERNTLTQAASISSPFFTGLNPSEINGNYSSDVFSIELNQKRIFNPYLRLLHGIRFVNVEEQLTFNSTGILGAGILQIPFSTNSRTRAKNPMLGYQLGAESRVTLVPGLDVTGYFKGGVYNNFSSQSTIFTVNPFPVSSTFAGSENELAFVSDFGARFHFNIVENFMSVFAGYDGMYVNSFAPAPANVNRGSGVVNDFDFWLHGVTFGIQVIR